MKVQRKRAILQNGASVRAELGQAYVSPGSVECHLMEKKVYLQVSLRAAPKGGLHNVGCDCRNGYGTKTGTRIVHSVQQRLQYGCNGGDTEGAAH
jgi:hypothetical protein